MKYGIVRILSWALTLTGMGYCASSFARHYQSIPLIDWDFLLATRIFLLVLIFSVAVLLYFEGWRVLVSSKNFPISFSKNFVLMGSSQIAKYIPGNIFHYAGRMMLAMKDGIPAGVIAESMALETVLSIATVMLIVLVGLLADSSFLAAITSLYPFNFSWWHLSFVGALIIIAHYCMREGQIREWLNRFIPYMKVRTICKSFIIYTLIFLLTALIIKLMPWALWNNKIKIELSYALWRVSICWLAGFFVPGAPAGLGVREALFIKLFAPELGEGAAASVAIVFRLITTFGDLLTFIIAGHVGRRVLQKHVRPPIAE